MYLQESHHETGRKTHICQDVSDRLSCHKESGGPRHGQELGTYSRFRRTGYSEVR